MCSKCGLTRRWNEAGLREHVDEIDGGGPAGLDGMLERPRQRIHTRLALPDSDIDTVLRAPGAIGAQANAINVFFDGSERETDVVQGWSIDLLSVFSHLFYLRHLASSSDGIVMG